MNQWLIRLFVPNSQDTANPVVRERYGMLAGLVGIVSNLILFTLKLLAGLLFGSIAVMADAVNNLSDAGSSIITLIGFKLSGKPADSEHPYGHARMEYITGLLVSIIIIVLGIQLALSSVEKIFAPEPTTFSPLVVVILVVSIFMKLWQGMFNRTVGKAIHSAALKATAADSLNDVVVTSAVLAGLLVGKLTGLQVDGFLGTSVAVFIIISGGRLVMETANPLLGTAPSTELVNQISQKVLGYQGVIGLHDLVVHSYGPDRCFASVHVEVSASQDILVSHDIIDNIERDFLDQLRIHLVIHLDPVVTDDAQTNQLKQATQAVVAELSDQLTMHDFRLVVGPTHVNLLFDVVVPIGFPMKDQELCHRITQEIQKLDPHYYTVITVDRSYISTMTKGS